jgi:hypothetical protein
MDAVDLSECPDRVVADRDYDGNIVHQPFFIDQRLAEGRARCRQCGLGAHDELPGRRRIAAAGPRCRRRCSLSNYQHLKEAIATQSCFAQIGFRFLSGGALARGWVAVHHSIA